MERNAVIEWAKESIPEEHWPMRACHGFNMEFGELEGLFPALPDGFYWDRPPASDDFQIHMKGSNPSRANYFWPVGYKCVYE